MLSDPLPRSLPHGASVIIFPCTLNSVQPSDLVRDFPATCNLALPCPHPSHTIHKLPFLCRILDPPQVHEIHPLLAMLLPAGGTDPRGTTLYPGGPCVGAGFRLILRTVSEPSAMFCSLSGKSVHCASEATVLHALTGQLCAVNEPAVARAWNAVHQQLQALHDSGQAGDQGLTEWVLVCRSRRLWRLVLSA